VERKKPILSQTHNIKGLIAYFRTTGISELQQASVLYIYIYIYIKTIHTRDNKKSTA
jgi:hypothetical protein